jgi:glycerol-3-phosphate O-acyltransferase
VCYVLETDSMADLAGAVQRHRQAQPAYPEKRSSSLPWKQRRSFFDVGRRARFWDATQTRDRRRYLLALVEALRADSHSRRLLVPTAVYWGRAPQKEGSWLRLLFAENWALTARVRKFFSVLVNGRNVMVEMGEPISLRSLLDAAPATTRRGASTASCAASCAGSAPCASARPLAPTHDRGPVLRARGGPRRGGARRRARNTAIPAGLLQARKYAFEIAANYSHAFVQIAEKLLGACGTACTTA